jgi:hypothetical protein
MLRGNLMKSAKDSSRPGVLSIRFHLKEKIWETELEKVL